MKKFLPKSKGFTLVELLVVVSIIAVLSVIGITIFTGVQKNARDAKRRADVDAISKTLEAHYNDTVSPCLATVRAPYCSQVHGAFFTSGTLPKDPNGTDYLINIHHTNGAGSPGDSYTVCALLENKNGNSSDTGNGTDFTVASGNAATHFCKKNQQ